MSFSAFELQIQASDATNLLGMLVTQLNAIGNPTTADANKMQFKAMCSDTFDELMRKLSSASDLEINQVNQFLSSNTKATNSIRNAVTTFYKKNCESLEQAANKYAQVIYDERKVILQEAWSYDPMETAGAGDAAFNFKNYNKSLNILEGNAPKIQYFYHESKEIAYQNNAKGDALSIFWSAFKPETNKSLYNYTHTSDDDITIGNQNIKDTDTMQNPIGNDESWIEHRKRALEGVKKLASKECSVLFQESNPISRFFMDVVNSVCESMDIPIPFKKHKTQQLFKEVVEKVREQAGLEEKGTLSNEKRSTPNP